MKPVLLPQYQTLNIFIRFRYRQQFSFPSLAFLIQSTSVFCCFCFSWFATPLERVYNVIDRGSDQWVFVNMST